MQNIMYQELENLARDFYELFDTMLSIYDSEKKLVVAYPHDLCEFCTNVRKNKELKARCLRHDHIAFDICEKTLMPYVYKCHMGLVETAEPIVKDGTILGFLLFGQLTDDQNNTAALEIISGIDQNVDKKKLIDSLGKVKYVNKERLMAMSRILVMCATYIQTKDIFGKEKEHMAYAITDYIRQNIRSKVTGNDLCHHLCVSRSTLFTLSKKYFGMGITEYINLVKITIAREKIKSADITVSQLAEEVGFLDSNYFCKVFKKFAGFTPSEYRERFKL